MTLDDPTGAARTAEDGRCGCDPAFGLTCLYHTAMYSPADLELMKAEWLAHLASQGAEAVASADGMRLECEWRRTLWNVVCPDGETVRLEALAERMKLLESEAASERQRAERLKVLLADIATRADTPDPESPDFAEQTRLAWIAMQNAAIYGFAGDFERANEMLGVKHDAD